MLLITAQGTTFDNLDEADAKAKAAAVHGPIYVCQVIGIWRPIIEPVEFVPMVDLPSESDRLSRGIAAAIDSRADELFTKPNPMLTKIAEAIEEGKFVAPTGEPAPVVIDPEDAAFLNQADAKQEAPPKRPRGRPRKAEPAPEPEVDPFRELAEQPAQIVIIEPETGGVAIGAWTCEKCGESHPASQRECCDELRPELQPKAGGGEPATITPPAPAIAPAPAGPAQPMTMTEREAILARRVGNDDETCLRCQSRTQNALVGKMTIRICSRENCYASHMTLRTYATIYGVPPDEPEERFEKTLELRREVEKMMEEHPVRAPHEIPDGSAITAYRECLGIKIENGPAEWKNEPITSVNADGSGGGQLKALNSALGGIGYGNGLRHPAVAAILGDRPRGIVTLSELSKNDAHLCLSWIEKAGPEHLAKLSALVPKERVVI